MHFQQGDSAALWRFADSSTSTHIFVLVLGVEAVLQEQVRGAKEGLQGHLHHHQQEQQQQLEAGNKRK